MSIALLALVASFILPTAGASAGPGSLVNGVVWADTNRDGLRNAGEPVRSGVTVQLLNSLTNAVISTTTTTATGAYSFANSADGDYLVRVDAPGAFRFPDAVSGDNDFARTGAPAAGQPERGATVPFVITGATQVTGRDAGMQPISNLTVERLPQANACEGFAVTGTAPFDPAEGPGMDTGPSNCIVRTMDTVTQQYSVALTGLPTGASVPNVVMEFTISSPDGAVLELVGPGTNGIPAGCLAAANGANPPSSRTINANGSITVVCNVGAMSSNVAAVQVAYRFAGNTPVPSHASIATRAYAGGGDAGTSNTVSGPVVEVTGAAMWDLRKIVYPSNGNVPTGPSYSVRTINGVPTEGYYLRYQFTIDDLTPTGSGSDLAWPATFVDSMPEFPGARIVECRSTVGGVDSAGGSPWTLTCPLNEVQGADGWNLSIRPNSGDGSDTGVGHMVMTVFIPMDEMNRAIDATWQPGAPAPTGTFDFSNAAEDTDHWALNGGAPNFAPDHEPGWDGTGNNLAILNGRADPPQWDLIKRFQGGPVYTTQTIGGESVNGYFVDYVFTIIDQAGAGNVAPWLDRPVTFSDKLVSHPGAILLSCRNHTTGSPARTNGTPTCETGAQPADGWDMSFVPDQTGFDRRRGDFIARIFLPMDELEGNPCSPGTFIDLENQAIDSDGWTAGGVPNNGTGFEPGWDGETATGNNLLVNRIRPSADQCGTLTGDKNFTWNGTNRNNTDTFGGDTVNSWVTLAASDNRVSVADMKLCDVFDVSVFRLDDGTVPNIGGTGITRADYVIEYAVGPNSVNTQAGAPVNGIFPADTTSLANAATGCRNDPGPWSTDPAADFGANWRDRVNMVRARPVDPAHVQVGPFSAWFSLNMDVRTFYNGGPHAGQQIPSGIRLSNIGGVPSGASGESWRAVGRNMIYRGMILATYKSATPTQYLPGSTVIWDLSTQAQRTTTGATMLDVRVVDTIPAGLTIDLPCTRDLLPAGVTLSYDPATRQATFRAGDIAITRAPNQWLFHITNAEGAPRLRLCTTVGTLAQPGDSYVNTVQATAANSENAPTATASIQIVGSGQMGITKEVDRAFVASGEQYNWTLEWGNTSTVVAFQSPDVIDVLPWNGDGGPGSGSPRAQYDSAYTGTARLTGPLAAPTYVRGATGAVPGTWYYTTAAPSSLSHDPRDASNADPAASGGLWRTAAEVGDLTTVTAVRFVSDALLPVQSRVRAIIPAVSTSNDLDNVYVNRAMIFSGTFANQPLLSNEPFVLMPGFTIGDLVWKDRNGNGRFDGGEQGVPGVTVQVRDAAGNVIATQVTDAGGRWSVAALPAGTYTVHIPAAMFAPGGPLADTIVRTVGSGTGSNPNEGADNNNTATPNPTVTGLSSTPITLSYTYLNQRLVGANGPTGDNVANLGSEMIPDVFTAFTVDLALMPTPGIDIEKATNAQDADTAPGPNVTVGDEVRWTYVVTNTGGVDLTGVTVTDDQIDAGDIDCAGTGSNIIPGPLAPGASVTCVAMGTATAGQYENLGSVVGSDPTGVLVDDEDPSHYFGIDPSVDIEKATNGQDADTPTGPLVTVGDAVRWTYVVTNTGSVPLTNVTVVDDLVAAAEIDCDDTGSNVIAGPLASGESFTCVAEGTAVSGQYANRGAVTGTAPSTTDVDGNTVAGAVVADEDPSHYFGIEPSVDIEKSTNGQDADTPTGPLVTVGDALQWTYVVTNNGNVALTDVTVTDDRVAAADIDCSATGSNVVPGPLAPGASFTCVATGEAVLGQYENLGAVTGIGPATTDIDGDTVPGVEVDDEDPSHYFGVEPSIDIEKATNSRDADTSTGPYVAVGGQVRWTYVVNNTGNAALTAVTVTDDLVAAAQIDCDGTGSNVIAGPLAQGESFTCVANGTAAPGQYTNLGTVTGIGPQTTDVAGNPVPGVEVDDTDRSHYFGALPGIVIEKATNTHDADEPTGPVINRDGAVRWTYVVTNTGNVTLTDVAV
ncbi:MAG: SdrD B-like domain-containing protein, partial [Microbacterium sp.]